MSEITEDTRVPLRLIQWLLGVLVTGLLGVGGLWVDVSNDLALMKQDTAGIRAHLEKIAVAVDGISTLRSAVDVHQYQLEQHDKRLDNLEAKVK